MDNETQYLIQQATQAARRLLEEEYLRQLEGKYDIHPNGAIAPNPGKHLDDREKINRGKIVSAIQHNAACGASPGEATNGYLREAAFTTLNRFVALKMMEARGLVRECVSRGEESSGYKEFLLLAPGLSVLSEQAYRMYIESIFDEIGLEVRVLFDRQDPASLLWPRRPTLLDLLRVLNEKELKDVWVEDETIGWVYQYFNPKEERDAMRKASRSPRNTRELAVRNQFFTPRYVVEFLTDNTLGRIWYEMRRGDTALKEGCRYIVRRPNEVFLLQGEEAPSGQGKETGLSQEGLLRKPIHIEHRPKKDPRDLRVLDPACGSGHFLLYAFDLLERIYEEAWADPESPKSKVTGCALREDFETLDDLRLAAPKLIIEHNLHGIDIDPRAVQIAVLALWLRAQRTWKNLELKASERARIARSNIVTAEPMPGEEDMRREFTAGLTPPVLGQLVDVVFDKMKLAGEAGSLLMIEEEIKDTVTEAHKQWMKSPKSEQQLLFPGVKVPLSVQQELRFDVKGVTDRFWEQAEDRILDALKDYAEQSENGYGIRRRLFAEDTARGFAFIDLCRNRYDTILMNPPFGASSRESKNYIDDRYPKTKGDVLANFIERTLHLTDKQGRVGAISSRTPFFLGSFETLRTEILGKIGHVHLLADLGEGVLEAMVETAIYVLTRQRSSEPTSLFFRLLTDAKKGELLQQLISECLAACMSEGTFVINPRHFETLNGHPYAYWVSKSTIRTLGDHPHIEGNKGAIRVGLQTGEDFRHLRLLWEIPNGTLVPRLPTKDNPNHTLRQQCIEQLRNVGSWVPFSKTDLASPWFSPITLAVNWARDGNELKNFTDVKGKLRSRPQNEDFYFKPGFSYMGRCTRLVPYLVPGGVMPTARRAQIFPKIGQEYAVLAICASNVGSAVARFRGEKFAWPNFQAGMVQGLPACDFPEGTLALIKEHVDAEVNKRRAVVQRYEPFQEFTLPAWIQTAEGGETAWDLYSLFGRGLENKIAEAFGLSSEQLVELERDIREAVSIRVRSEDVRFEDAGEDLNGDEQELSIELISETPEEKAVGLFSYGVGVALGRWDVRIAIDPSFAPKLPDPFDPLPVCPPGMLISPNGLPAEPGRIVSEEWLRTRPDAITLPPKGSVTKPAIPDTEYPIRISWDGVLVDDAGFSGGHPHTDDILRRVREVNNMLWKDKAHEIEQEGCGTLGVSDLRDYFRKSTGFFQDHLKRYSKNRRKAPIYWRLSTSSGNYSVWLYYHRLTKDTFYKVLNEYINPKIAYEERDLTSLRQEAGPNPSASQRKEIDARAGFLDELRVFRDEIARIATLWSPNLNDGVIINYAPLWRLVPHHRAWQKDLKECWDSLIAGDYDWSHLAMHLWSDRVVPKCADDLSLAIAHGLENVFWEKGAKEKPKKRKVPVEEAKRLVAERTSSAVKASLTELLSVSGSVENGERIRKTREKSTSKGRV